SGSAWHTRFVVWDAQSAVLRDGTPAGERRQASVSDKYSGSARRACAPYHSQTAHHSLVRLVFPRGRRMSASPDPTPPSELDKVVAEIAVEAHVRLDTLRPEERRYLEDHALKKPMGVLHVWALGVGVVITGEYFGWNQGLAEGGPVGMLLASLFVCALYMAWVLCLSELSVAMPFAGGPLAYGRRAFGPGLGFFIGWSMFLEALFATIGTAIATGGYIFFVINLLVIGLDEPTKRLVTMWAGLATVLIFAIVQWVGAHHQAKMMEWMTYGAIAG